MYKEILIYQHKQIYFIKLLCRRNQVKCGMKFIIQGVSGGKVNILGGHSIGHSKQKVYVYICPIPNGFRDRAISL
jgi:hypothetical protein